MSDVVVWCSPGTPAPGRTYAHAVTERLAAGGVSSEVRPVEELGRLRPRAGSVHLLTGGETSVLDSTWPRGWRAGLRRLAAAGARGDALVLGICFGSQALAEALAPGSVRVGTELRLGLTEAQQPGRRAEAVPSFHYERVAPAFLQSPRARATWLGPGDLVHAYRAGRAVLGYQFHPELAPDDLPVLASTHPGLLQAFGTEPGDVGAAVAAARSRWSADLWERCVGAPVAGWLAAGAGVPQPRARRPARAAVQGTVTAAGG